ncbi:hypothetical protein EJD93_22435 (plasmid) [Cronobacter sakazakii]|uniref:hypothetical protein n=1 Tax=Cronobacter sakazakii TaxID=28141 RepID=UPI001E3E562A|nr:hypothetical protein [Cronobacter sakazakii]UEQ65059.1 hypothetical protein EJD93_04315 [Cronobacter sakazakii]UEQ68542.1 hypothetical protein EJD93_22435 [Cronobacter sakazakii]
MNNDELIAAGHDLAKCLDSNTPLLDIAKMIVRLADKLDVTTLALREKTKQCEQLAAENAHLLPKAASELSNAWVLHKYLIGIQAAIMYLGNGNNKAAQEWLYGTIAGPGFEFPDGVEDIDAWATHQMRGSISHPRALEIIKAETPATDAFLREVRASAVDAVCLKISNSIVSCRQDEMIGLDEAVNIASDFAVELRQGGAA